MYSATVLLSIIILTFSLWIRWRKRRMNLLERCGIPGPKPNFITGNINEFHEKRDKCIDEWMKKYGKMFGFYFGAKYYVITSDLDFIKTMQIKEFKNFSNKDLVLPDGGIPHKLYKEMLEFQNDEKWKNMRSILSTSFSSGKIKKMSTLMDEPIKVFLRKIEKENGEYFKISEFFKNLTFDIICRSAFGIKTNVQNNEISTFVQSVYNIFNVDSSDILSTFSIYFPEFEPIPTYLRHFVDFLRNVMNLPCTRVVVAACKQIIDSRKKSNYHPPDLLQTMLDAEDESNVERKLTSDSVIGNALAFMVAGFETSSSTLGWCTHFLAHHPEVQEQVRREINNNVKPNEEIEYRHLVDFKFLDQVISETLRLEPLATIVINRVCAEDFKYKEMTIPKGTIVIVPVPTLQNDPNYWPESEEFIPERFSPENRIDPFIYQPFGAGPRICIGMRLAHTVMKLTLTNLIRSFKLEPYGNKNVEKEHTLFVSHPKHGITVKAIPISLQ